MWKAGGLWQYKVASENLSLSHWMLIVSAESSVKKCVEGWGVQSQINTVWYQFRYLPVKIQNTSWQCVCMCVCVCFCKNKLLFQHNLKRLQLCDYPYPLLIQCLYNIQWEASEVYSSRDSHKILFQRGKGSHVTVVTKTSLVWSNKIFGYYVHSCITILPIVLVTDTCMGKLH